MANDRIHRGIRKRKYRSSRVLLLCGSGGNAEVRAVSRTGVAEAKAFSDLGARDVNLWPFVICALYGGLAFWIYRWITRKE
jgi:hypothetical protein